MGREGQRWGMEETVDPFCVGSVLIKVTAARGRIWYNFPCKTVPIYKVLWCMLHMDGKLFESTFTLNKQFIISHTRIHSFIPCIQSIAYAVDASQCFVLHHEAVVASFNMSNDRPRFEGQPMKGSRPPHVKQSQGRKHR